MLRSLYFALFLCFVQSALTLFCSRYPANTFSPKSPVDESFVLLVTGNPETYILGQEYNISLNAFNGLRFISFSLSLETESGETGYATDLGQFKIIDEIETRYSPNCINMVESTNMNGKTRVDVAWVAPTSPGSGCILIRTTVLQHRDVWFMDDGGLTRILCEQVVDEVESQKNSLEEQTCCACDEARYELSFEGKWSRNLHPKDFPAKGWITRYGDIVGASHVTNYSFWRSGEMTSIAMKEYGEFGSTRLLEHEFNANFKNGNIRTIVKSRGLAFPNIQGKSLAYVRVDPTHHLLSLASKIEPSPDWIVGISGLELCMSNCTWIESKEISLYPWDLGTDAGPSYTSADQPQMPPDVIRRISSDSPSDIRSPFFDESGAPMKPMAMLTVRRLRLYDRLCEDEESNNIDIPRECYTHPWTGWTECSAKCGKGQQYRTRVYKQPELAEIYGCDINKWQSQECIGDKCKESEPIWDIEEEDPINEFRNEAEYQFPGAYDNREFRGSNDNGESLTKASCQLSIWSPWSKCSKICGEGQEIRTREYVNPTVEKWCQDTQYMKLKQYRRCIGQDCLGDVRNNILRKNFGRGDIEEQQTHNGETESNGFENENGNKFKHNQENRNNYGVAPDDNQQENDSTNYANHGNTAYEQQQKSQQQQNVNSRNSYENRNSNDNRNTYENRNSNDNRDSYKNNDNKNSYNRNSDDNRNSYENTQTNSPVLLNRNADEEDTLPEPQVIECCFQKLQIYPCLNNTIIANYWFYNYCTDECMLFFADKCDNNDNKYTTMEACEARCRTPIHETYLRQRQQDCHINRLDNRPRKKSRRYP